jgi:PPP family 3-phenylpropionic acid transporter
MRPGFVPRVAALYAAVFLNNGVQLPFLPVWFAAKEVDPKLIGLIVAVPMFARMLSVPIVAREADRRDAVRAAIVLAGWASVVFYVVVGLSSGGLAILVAYAVASLAFTPLLPLTETYALKGLAERGRAYGPVRLWGSFAFIAGNFLGGFLLDAIPARDLIWPIVGTVGLTALTASLLRPQSIGRAEPRESDAPLWRDPAFLAVLIGASLIQASHSIYYIFSALQWRSDGISGGVIAALWALGVVAEIVLFAVSGRLNVSPTTYLLIGAGGAVLRWGVMALDPPALALPFLQLLHALSFGATHLGALTYVAQRARPGQAATAQGHLAIAISAAGGAAAALSGVLYSNFGSASYATMALMAVAGGACGCIARRRAAIAPV